MHSSRQEMLNFMHRAEELVTGHVVFAERFPLPEFGAFPHPSARFILPLAGVKRVTFGDGVRRVDAELQPGDAIFCRPGAWVDEHFEWPHQMISVVLHSAFVRYLYIAQRVVEPRNGPDVFFHTLRPPETALRSAADTLEAIRPESRAAGHAFGVLLSLAVEMLESEDDGLFSEEDRIWCRFDEWLRTHFSEDVARDDLAAGAEVSPAKLSRLVHARTGTGVREYLNAIRLDHALELLRGGCSIEEISRRCGFSYPGYFIRLFRRRYGRTPGEYRKWNG